MKRQLQFVLLLTQVVVLLAIVPQSARGKIHTGLGRLEGWDFSDSTVASTEWDIDLMVVLQLAEHATSAGIYWIVAPNGVALMPSDSTYEVLTMAPEYPSGYLGALNMVPYRTWVCRTREGCFAKFQFLGESIVEFEYTYQDNGTRYFRDGVPVADTTWGKIKELFQ
jgi:hypothetical protein